ncbi:VRR-NUC domain-containing protein [Alicyclobacillus tolerans]|uniref:VRR-NUC domain-containing protein n=1 Tax=Alicyclobacillus tolerans TaxID=90970 RepID=UPI001F263E09|nr:VRR-NUC domain-containing protein [Alicyclobacillus tolerans]MCF8566892.1 VRR-NUC domain-containing protein [Alicyclobacillus tolerans]
MRERDVEQYLREQVRAAGGRAYKFTSPGNAGVPDRMVLFPGGRVAFVELKAPGKKPTALQLAQHKKFAGLGFTVAVIDRKSQVDEFLAAYRQEVSKL